MSTDYISAHLRQLSDERLAELRSHVADQVTVYRLRIDVEGPSHDLHENLWAYEGLLQLLDGEIQRRRMAVPQADGDDGRAAITVVVTEIG